MALGLVDIVENVQNLTCFSIYFFYLKQLNRNKLWYPPKCVPFSAVTNLPNKILIFLDFQGPTTKFHEFPSLENEILKFHDFPGFP